MASPMVSRMESAIGRIPTVVNKGRMLWGLGSAAKIATRELLQSGKKEITLDFLQNKIGGNGERRISNSIGKAMVEKGVSYLSITIDQPGIYEEKEAYLRATIINAIRELATNGIPKEPKKIELFIKYPFYVDVLPDVITQTSTGVLGQGIGSWTASLTFNYSFKHDS